MRLTIPGLLITALLLMGQEPGAVREDPAMQPATDQPGLPRVLLIGDSISIGYTLPVRKLLQGRANLHRIPANGGPTTTGVAELDAWLGAGHWDVIHFNFGLHDLKFMEDGRRQVSLADYQANLEKIVSRLEKTGAKLIFATTTPVPVADNLRPKRLAEDVPAYNRAALRVMGEHGIAVDDLYGFALPRLDQIQRPANVHYTAEGYEALARQVAESIESVLKPRQ